MLRRQSQYAVRIALVICLAAFLLPEALPPASADDDDDEGQRGRGAVLGAEIKEKRIPRGVDVFNLSLRQTRALSQSKNFKVVGHSYLKGPWLTPFARQNGLGAGFNTPRVHDGIAYLAGYNSPATLFGVLIADVRDPEEMEVLSFIPCNPGTRCPYIRVNTRRQILVGTHDRNADNPTQPPAGQPTQAGVTFHDVSDPRNP